MKSAHIYMHIYISISILPRWQSNREFRQPDSQWRVNKTNPELSDRINQPQIEMLQGGNGNVYGSGNGSGSGIRSGAKWAVRSSQVNVIINHRCSATQMQYKKVAAGLIGLPRVRIHNMHQ